ncbi:hypothetical protein [Dolichospermum circinale]|uniref:hypothetical protein n=1 Tax=Dolichospermum circinale TaxID=109265 RepID=UPI00040102D9|nr:hypothetical protein [Dolichospermum circinale]MDB9455950.1 hypothetical protein [Dolichospermum circinale CS-541/06]MDB9462328.1 hypothetical protein [Dolichospermum circinale CS-541/04]MDB9475398.1 hypothetical protein [Dolichospermum circinale CS-537/11]MDB9478327.1 hypothetical protein [Dolichospermum circinale CS-537/03]MDB9490402.1 hypothetical protein [Dolichospermum circinale CS-534/05]
MIIYFNPAIFQTQDDDMQSILADILVELLKDKHFIDTKSIKSIFFDNNNKYIFNQNKIAQAHLSDTKRQNLKDYICKKVNQNITQLHRNHLTHLTIGTNPEEVHPKDACKILTERSIIIVENGINDRKFIEGISQKYSSSKKRGSIYILISDAIKREIIEFDNAGGSGEIQKRIQYLMNAPRYFNIYKYKLVAIFDSDKNFDDDFNVRKYKKLIEFLKNREISNPPCENDINYEDHDLIIWHILYKRELENYLPLEILFKKAPLITQDQKDHLSSKSESDLDFLEYNKDNNKIGQIKIKEEFPEMFLGDFSYRLLEQRCEHHKVFLPEANELVSELEQILLKIAKII